VGTDDDTPQVQFAGGGGHSGQRSMQSSVRLDRSAMLGPNKVAAAHNLAMMMYESGFKDEHIQDARIAQIAQHFYQQQPSMLHTVVVAANNLSPAEVTVDSVNTIENMISHGFESGKISRPDIHTAALCRQSNVNPTPQNVRQW